MDDRNDKDKSYDFVEDMVGWLRWPEDTPDWVRTLPAVILLLIVVGMFIASRFV